MSEHKVSVDDEELECHEIVATIEKWWQSSRHAHIYRPYTAAKIAPLRCPLDGIYPSNKQAQKLWRQLNEHRQNKTAEMTFGMIDPLLASQMIGQQTIYISGALCAFSAADCSGQDTSDYPWDTVPKVAERMFRSQRYHDRRQRQYRLQMSKEERKRLPEAQDFLQPIVADADMGFGSTTAIVKLVQRLVEAGVAMFHIDDLAIGSKRFTKNEGPTVVPTSEYLSRLCAARMQLDIMGADTLLMTRCDVDGAQYITSDIDPRDHGYILGATRPVSPFMEVMRQFDRQGSDLRVDAEAERWLKDANIMTFDEAVESVATVEQFKEYSKKLLCEKFHSLSERRRYAKDVLGDKEVFFDWNLPRTEDGRYRFAPSTETIVERCLHSAPLGDVTWARMDFIWENLVKVHKAVETKYPGRLFAAGYSATYDFAAKGYTPVEVDSFHHELAKLGIVWQLQPGFAMQGLNYVTKQFSTMWAREGIAGYARDIQKPAMEIDTDTYEKMSWSGGYLADALTDLVKETTNSLE